MNIYQINSLAYKAINNGSAIIMDSNNQMHFRTRYNNGKWEARDGGTWITVSGTVMVEDNRGRLYAPDVCV